MLPLIALWLGPALKHTTQLQILKDLKAFQCSWACVAMVPFSCLCVVGDKDSSMLLKSN